MQPLISFAAPLAAIALYSASLFFLPVPREATLEERAELAIARLKMGDMKASQAMLEDLAKQAPDNARVRFGAGMAAYNQKQAEKAEEHLKATVRLDPDNYDAALTLGAIYQRAGREAEADALYQEIRRRQPGNAKVLMNLHTLEVARKGYAKARDYLIEYLKLVPRAPNKSKLETRIKRLDELAKEKASKK